MIELVFVIVILGILANLGIQRMAATKYDAMAAKSMVELQNVIKELSEYAITGGDVSDDMDFFHPNMLAERSATYRRIREERCGTFSAANAQSGCWMWCADVYPYNYENATDSEKGKAYITVRKIGYNTIKFCKAIYKTPLFQEFEDKKIPLKGESIFDAD